MTRLRLYLLPVELLLALRDPLFLVLLAMELCHWPWMNTALATQLQMQHDGDNGGGL